MDEQNEKDKAIVVLSGGLDSTTALYWAFQKYEVVGAISFDYGQRHKRELEYAKRTCEKLGIRHRVQVVDISDERSSLANENVEVPHGHYEEETMKITVVNNRNSIMFSLATAWAIDLKADYVVVGIHAGDHAIYPDCRTEYIKAFNRTMQLANEGFISSKFSILAPFVNISKTDIAELAILLDVPLEETYSDYEGGEVQKGRSGTAVERIEAISEAFARIRRLIAPYTHFHKDDPTKYEEKNFALDLLIKKTKTKTLDRILSEIDGDLEVNFNR